MTSLVRFLDVADAPAVDDFDRSDNTASRALRAAPGFRELGTCERHAWLGGIWHDILIVEKRLERL